MHYAYCYRSGHLEIGNSIPSGALPIVRCASEKKLRDVIEARARWAYDNKTMLVPGIPEASNTDEAMTALDAFTQWIWRDYPELRPQPQH